MDKIISPRHEAIWNRIDRINRQGFGWSIRVGRHPEPAETEPEATEERAA